MYNLCYKEKNVTGLSKEQFSPTTVSKSGAAKCDKTLLPSHTNAIKLKKDSLTKYAKN